ncbi:MAG: ORF6N domain-containing protein [Verrucomicrobia bacterium]|nr:ORF6N domain-containing protein [Verrucomicrobiota bacterium]MDA1066200.1 ORF6N domain-containing protein [Verrucomicrobiota bacterium]
MATKKKPTQTFQVYNKPPIYTVRGLQVVLDSDLAFAYEVETRVFNQAVKRNLKRFPEEFAFQLTHEEFRNLISQSVTSSRHGGRRKPPFVFTEHGTLMAATILNSDEAVKMSVFILRAFVRQRELLSGNEHILKRLAETEKTLLQHDNTLWDIYQKLVPLIAPASDDPKKRIGFQAKECKAKYLRK